MLDKAKIDFELQENEIMRLSLRKSTDSPTGYILVTKGNGDKGLMLDSLVQYMKIQFDLICVPQKVLKQLGFEIVEIRGEEYMDSKKDTPYRS